MSTSDHQGSSYALSGVCKILGGNKGNNCLQLFF